MADNNSLVNLGSISKPATVLVEKISAAIGGIFQPFQIVRVAKAEAEADRIRAESQIAIDDLHRRALQRFLLEEGRKQANMEEITQRALPGVAEEANPENLDDDWITNFFDKCRLISDHDMQNLWARVLAGEANVPGSRGRDGPSPPSWLGPPPAQIPAGGTTALGSCLGSWRESVVRAKDEAVGPVAASAWRGDSSAPNRGGVADSVVGAGDTKRG